MTKLSPESVRADIALRSAGAECVTIWKDGSFAHWGYRDAEIATQCEPSAVLVTINLETMDAATFLSPQDRINLATKMFGG